VVDRNVVLNLAAVSDHYAIGNKRVLPKGYALADSRPPANVGEVPDTRAFTHRRAGIDDCGFVLEVRQNSHLASRGWNSPTSGAIAALRISATVEIAVRLSSSPNPRPARISS